LLTDIDERRRAEEKLRRSEAYLSEAQKLSHTGSFGWDVSSGEIYWSEETFRIFQYNRTTKPTVELVLRRVHPEDGALVKQTIERVSQDGTDFEHEYRLLMPDSSVKYVHVVAHALRDESDRSWVWQPTGRETVYVSEEWYRIIRLRSRPGLADLERTAGAHSSRGIEPSGKRQSIEQ
jgi:PAS domain-containing protein